MAPQLTLLHAPGLLTHGRKGKKGNDEKETFWGGAGGNMAPDLRWFMSLGFPHTVDRE